MTEREYNRGAVLDYAKKWAFGRNPAYYDFEEIGGDCTNFASQCIYAGAGIMNYTPVFGWYYRSTSDRTASWTGVEFLYDFLTTNKSVGPYGSLVSPTDILPGDVVQLSFDGARWAHTPVVVAVGSPRSLDNVLVAAHSEDADDRPLSDYDYADIRFLHIFGVYKP